MLDLGGYLNRIGLSGQPALADIHRAHVVAIPFENLDPYTGAHVSLAPGDLERKLVQRRRGGYCFEHNLLLGAALRARGAEVEPMLARVRLGAPPGTVRPRTHLVLRVRDGAASWLADVGFGAGTLMEPIPFRPGGTYEQSGWRFRVIQDDSELVLQTARAGDWLDLYGFAPEPVPLIDVETSNWFTTAHPSSTFVTGLIVCATASDGRRTALSDWSGTLKLTEQAPDGESVTEVDRARVPELLADRFGLPGWALDAADRLVATSRGHRPQAVAGEAQ